ncbi:hypothetical protein GFL95_14265 [Rhizobium leguminosarum bv. viciae]|uniref:hypothetical protein n=1 Tax=Rhizobium leguminosarum TaxID=384 RepID=UPI0014423538|nr:hypothetical protein [Rhizobium leguminosarum]NKK92380.1 hypothetical protein [Rhizobium leguminosarum bv. viciae]
MKIDLSRLAVIEQTKDADRGAWQEADEMCRKISRENSELSRQKMDIENSPPVVDQEAARQRYATLQSLQARIEANKKKFADLKVVRDMADEKMRASQELWDNCAKFAGIR